MKNKLIGIIICMLFVGTVLPASGTLIIDTTTSSNKSGNTLYVGGTGDGNYTKIQDAIDAADPYDTVFVYNGTYYEAIQINKDGLTLHGEDKNTTIIDGFQDFQVVRIYRGYQDPVENVLIKGFTIRNCSNKPNGHTIFIDGNYNTISGNIITGKTAGAGAPAGVHSSSDSSWNEILDNSISLGNTGISIYESSNNLCKGNTIHNLYIAIGIHTDTTSINNQILNNYIYNTDYGIRFFNSISMNIISGNTLYNNQNGIMIHMNNDNNKIYHNNFINSPVFDEAINIWDNGGSSGGNYWSDYEERYPDAKPKLFKPWMWDTPYEIEGSTNKDMCPLIKQWPDSKPRDVSDVEDDCDCQVVNRYDLFRVKLLMIRLKVVSNILLLRFGYIPEVTEKCSDILENLNLNKLQEPPIICGMLESIWNQLYDIEVFVQNLLKEYENNPIIYRIIIYCLLAPITLIGDLVHVLAINLGCDWAPPP